MTSVTLLALPGALIAIAEAATMIIIGSNSNSLLMLSNAAKKEILDSLYNSYAEEVIDWDARDS